MSIESVMPSNHLTLCRPLLLPPSIFPSIIRVFSSESALLMRWPKYWSFSFSISPSNEYSGLISFRIDWFHLLTVQGTLKTLLQQHSSKAPILRRSAFFIVQLSHSYTTTGKTTALTRWTSVGFTQNHVYAKYKQWLITISQWTFQEGFEENKKWRREEKIHRDSPLGSKDPQRIRLELEPHWRYSRWGERVRFWMGWWIMSRHKTEHNTAQSTRLKAKGVLGDVSFSELVETDYKSSLAWDKSVLSVFLPFRWAHNPLPQGKLQECTRDGSHVRQGRVPVKGKLKVPGDSGRKAWSSHLHAQFGFFQKMRTHGILRGLWVVFLVDFPPKSYTHRDTDTHRYWTNYTPTSNITTPNHQTCEICQEFFFFLYF